MTTRNRQLSALRQLRQLRQLDGTLALGFQVHAHARIDDANRHASIMVGMQWAWPMPTARHDGIVTPVTLQRCSRCDCNQSECMCSGSSSGSSYYNGCSFTLDSGEIISVEYELGSGAETQCYTLDGTDDVLLVVASGSADKDVMSALHSAGYAHTVRVEYLGMNSTGTRKVYRAERIEGIGYDPDGIASAIRCNFAQYDLLGSCRRMVRNGVPRSVVKTLIRMLKVYRQLGHDPHLDLHAGNYATHNGRFILLDPFYRG